MFPESKFEFKKNQTNGVPCLPMKPFKALNDSNIGSDIYLMKTGHNKQAICQVILFFMVSLQNYLTIKNPFEGALLPCLDVIAIGSIEF